MPNTSDMQNTSNTSISESGQEQTIWGYTKGGNPLFTRESFEAAKLAGNVREGGENVPTVSTGSTDSASIDATDSTSGTGTTGTTGSSVSGTNSPS